MEAFETKGCGRFEQEAAAGRADLASEPCRKN
jgi:hypothetical protein